MPACRQAVGCDVCDTPELWLWQLWRSGVAPRACVRVYARVLWCGRIFTYIHTYTPELWGWGVAPRACVRVYARVLVPPAVFTNLHVHVHMLTLHGIHICIIFSAKILIPRYRHPQPQQTAEELRGIYSGLALAGG